MSKSAQINLTMRIDKELKETAIQILAEMGLTLTIAVEIFLRQVVRLQKIPFDIAGNLQKIERTESVSITVRTDSHLKENATTILEGMGLTLSSAIRLYLRQIVIYSKIPFEISIVKDEI